MEAVKLLPIAGRKFIVHFGDTLSDKLTPFLALGALHRPLDQYARDRLQTDQAQTPGSGWRESARQKRENRVPAPSTFVSRPERETHPRQLQGPVPNARKRTGCQYRTCGETSCNPILARFLLVKSPTQKGLAYSIVRFRAVTPTQA